MAPTCPSGVGPTVLAGPSQPPIWSRHLSARRRISSGSWSRPRRCVRRAGRCSIGNLFVFNGAQRMASRRIGCRWKQQTTKRLRLGHPPLHPPRRHLRPNPLSRSHRRRRRWILLGAHRAAKLLCQNEARGQKAHAVKALPRCPMGNGRTRWTMLSQVWVCSVSSRGTELWGHAPRRCKHSLQEDRQREE
jgi:hypothetical protein